MGLPWHEHWRYDPYRSFSWGNSTSHFECQMCEDLQSVRWTVTHWNLIYCNKIAISTKDQRRLKTYQISMICHKSSMVFSWNVGSPIHGWFFMENPTQMARTLHMFQFFNVDPWPLVPTERISPRRVTPRTVDLQEAEGEEEKDDPTGRCDVKQDIYCRYCQPSTENVE